jgi:hypothetical protein
MFTRKLTGRITQLAAVLFLLAKFAEGQSPNPDPRCHLKMAICQADSFYEPFGINSDTGFRSNITLDVPQQTEDSISITVNDVNGREVLFERFPPLAPSRYVISFPAVGCSGVYFVRINLGTNTFVRHVALQATSSPSVGVTEKRPPVTSNLQAFIGTWKKTYTQILVPQMQELERSQIPEKDIVTNQHDTIFASPPTARKLERDTVTHEVILRFEDNWFTIIWTTNQAGRDPNVHRYHGGIRSDADTLRFLDSQSGAPKYAYRAQVVGDSLSLSPFLKVEDDHMVAPMRPLPFVISLVLDGIYRRVRDR